MIKAGKLVRAVGSKLLFDLNGVTGIITSLSEGAGPAPDKVEKFNAFFKQVANKLVFFYPPPRASVKQAAGKLNFAAAEVRGKPALLELFNQISSFKDKGGIPSLDQVAPLRTYKYALEPKMIEVLNNWVTVALQNHKVNKNLLSIKDDSQALVPLAQGAGAASSSVSLKSKGGVTIATPLKPVDISKAPKGRNSIKKKTADLEEDDESVLGFFGGKRLSLVSSQSYGVVSIRLSCALFGNLALFGL